MTSLCPGGDVEAALAPYRALVARVDEMCARVVAAFPDQITCRAGCATCCILQGVLPVEAANLVLAWRQLPEVTAASLRARLDAVTGSTSCPLLTDDCCPLYAARPVICRTHGLPLLVEEAGGHRVDRCPLNFTTLATLPGTAVIDLERLNQALVLANRHFLSSCFPDGGVPERIPLHRILSFPPSP